MSVLRVTVIDLEAVKYYCGLGDIAMLAWLATGAKAAGTPLAFYRRRNAELLHLFGLDVRSEPGGLNLDWVFKVELGERGSRTRLDYLRDALGITAPYLRPELHLSDDDTAWAEARAADFPAPLVLLFPQTAWKPREWPPNGWVDLAWGLKREGLSPLVMLEKEDPRFANTPVFQWGTPIPKLAALMRHAALVVGNDSFPAHLAGTVGTPTLALLGPTKPMVFGHTPDVECMQSDLDCTGCHFAPPFRAACDQGCFSLFRLSPDDVLRRVLEKVRPRPGVLPLA